MEFNSRFFAAICFFLLIVVLATGCKKGKESSNRQAGHQQAIDSSDALAASKAPTQSYNRYWNDLARYLGGLKPLAGSKLLGIDNRPEAEAHQQHVDKEWAWKDSTLLHRLKPWADTVLRDAHQLPLTVLYPFSGPDFVTVQALYPNAPKYVMFGLEMEGPVPAIKQISVDRLPINLKNLQQSVSANLRDSFFYTLDMSADLYRTDLVGTTPLLLFMLARSGKEVLHVRRIKINSQGTIDTVAAQDTTVHQGPHDTLATGMEFHFRATPDAPVQVLQYFCLNVDNEHYLKMNALKRYLESLAPTLTYFKSASYLTHNDYFSAIRNTLLSVSALITQDDTGPAFRYLNPTVWNVSFYGRYIAPIPLFKNYYQPYLAAAYDAAADSVKKINFDMGYKSSTNILISRKRSLCGTNGRLQKNGLGANQSSTDSPVAAATTSKQSENKYVALKQVNQNNKEIRALKAQKSESEADLQKINAQIEALESKNKQLNAQ
jgi:hypothetical protein